MFDPLENVKELLRKAAHVNKNAALNCLQGEIVNISDPLKEGRCQIRLINFSSTECTYASDWSLVLSNRVYKGLLPKSILGKQVLVFPVNNSYEELQVNLHGPLIYSNNEELPIPCLENLGVKIIILTEKEAYNSVCLLRNGEYVWEAMCPLKHGHSSGDTQDQARDAGGDLEMPIEQGAINDEVFGTSVTPYIKNSGTLPPIL
jgi:hypothetical protein